MQYDGTTSTEATGKTHRFIQKLIIGRFDVCLSELLAHAVLDLRINKTQPGEKVIDKFPALVLCCFSSSIDSSPHSP